MWNYETQSKDVLLKHFDKIPHQKAHVLYCFGDVSDAMPLYTDTINRFIPKLIKAHTNRSSEVVLRFAARMALYAYRSHNTELLTRLWLDYPLAYQWTTLSGRSIQNIAIIGILAQKESDPTFQTILDLLPSEHILHRVIMALTKHESLNTIIPQFRQIFETAYDVPATPWSDEPLIGVYERLHTTNQLDWTM